MERCILVITATLGTRDTLRRTVESVKKIGGKYVNHVIVAPNVVIPKLQREYPDLEFLEEPEGKKGIYPAINYGFYTYGHDYKYLTFINDDDYWLPDYALLINYIVNHEEIDFVYGRTLYVDENNTRISEQTSSCQFYSFLSLLRSNIVLLTQQATILKSSFYFRIGGFDEGFQLVADTKFWVELSLIKPKFKYFNHLCAAYMVQDGQLSSNKELSYKEHNSLIALFDDVNIIKLKVFIDKILYRLINIRIYVNRLFRCRIHAPL